MPRATSPSSSSSTTTAATASGRSATLPGSIEQDKQVKLILKEFPILSKGSEETAKVALAAKMQGKYWEFHRAMIERRSGQ